MVIRCENCIHNRVCYLQEVTDDINKQLDEFGCEDYTSVTDFAEVKHRYWIYEYSGECLTGTDASLSYKCSECRGYTVDEENYCPNCGAKMDGGKAK